MTYGIEFINGSQDRIISDKAYNFHYIGAATHVSDLSTAGGFASIKAVLLSYFNISSATPPICFIEGSAGGGYAIVSQRDLGGNVWEIVVASFPQSVPTLHCFQQIPAGVGLASPTDFGLAVYDASGNLAFDSNKKQLDHQYFTQINTPVCARDNGVNQLCAGTAFTALGGFGARPAFMFVSRGRACLIRTPQQDEKKFIHLCALTGGGALVSWGCVAFLPGVLRPALDFGGFADTIIVIDAARFV